MKKISSSPDRYSFGRTNYEKKLKDDPNNSSAVDMLEYYDLLKVRDTEQTFNAEFQKNNLEYDLRSTEWICEKARTSKSYAQNLYAAMCNNEFIKRDMWPLLKEETWSCSWRYAGGIIAHMVQEGDYIDWYCSGIRGGDDYNAEDHTNGYVSESVVTEEIESDLYNLGWLIIKDNSNE